MIAKVRRVWRGEKRVTVILVEDGQTKETAGFLWLPEQELQARLCEQAESLFAMKNVPRFVVQLAPPERFGHHHIEVIEMLHAPRETKAETAPAVSDPFARMDDGIEKLRFDFDRAHGMTRRILS